MPFRRKHRNPLFGSSRSRAASPDKENATAGPMTDHHLPAGQPPKQQKEAPLSEPRLFRCHSDSTQRTCSDLNPNTLGNGVIITASTRAGTHRHGVLSTKEKMSNLLQLNATLVKEVTSLRASQHSMAASAKALSEQLQASLQEKEELEDENRTLAASLNEEACRLAERQALMSCRLETVQTEMNQKLEAERQAAAAAEDRLQSVSLVVDNLQSINGVLAEEAARLREDADHSSAQKNALLADLEKMLCEKNILEQLVESIRASGDAFRQEMQQALAQSDMERNALYAEKQTLLTEKVELQSEAEKLSEEVSQLSSENTSLLSEREELIVKKEKLEGELSGMVATREELQQQLDNERQALDYAQANFKEEKKRMLAEKGKLESSLAILRDDHQEIARQLEAERQASASMQSVLRSEMEQLRLHNKKLADDKEILKQGIDGCRIENQRLLSQGKKQHEELKTLQKELLLTKNTAAESEKLAKANLDSVLSEKNEAASMFDKQLKDATAQVSVLQARIDTEVKRSEELEFQLKALQRENSAAQEASLLAKDTFEKILAKKTEETEKLHSNLRELCDQISSLERQLGAMNQQQSDLQLGIKALECELAAAQNAILQAEVHAKAKDGETAKLTENLEEASQRILSLESKLSAEKETQKSLEAQIQIMKGDLLVAEDAALEAQKKAKTVEKGAKVAVERQSREASQKIGALEAKLAAGVERQADLQSQIQLKDSACKAAVQAEREAKARLNGLLDAASARGKTIEGQFELLQSSFVQMQNLANRGNQTIAALQAEFSSLMAVNVPKAKSNKRRNRSNARPSCQVQICT